MSEFTQIRFEELTQVLSSRSEIKVIPKALKKRFGKAEVQDSEKEIGAYFFKDDSGNEYSLFQRFYDDHNYLMKFLIRKTFWTSSNQEELMLQSSSNDITQFLEWIGVKS